MLLLLKRHLRNILVCIHCSAGDRDVSARIRLSQHTNCIARQSKQVAINYLSATRVKDSEANATRSWHQTQALCSYQVRLNWHLEMSQFFPFGIPLKRQQYSMISAHRCSASWLVPHCKECSSCLASSLIQTTLHPLVIVFTGQNLQAIQISHLISEVIVS